jgi:CubicO group peptidase (beta-lactamase class C family)
MSDTRNIDFVLRSAIGAVPGVVALATTRNGTIYEGAFGYRDLSTEVPMTLDTVFWLASMTKAFTSAAALQLVDQARLSLDAPIAGVLPELTEPQVLEGFSDEGAPRLRPAASPITLRQLLNHSAGYGYSVLSSDLTRYLEEAGVPAMPECFTDLRRTPLLFDPGARWHYGLSTDVVGKAVERASGQGLDEYLAEHVLGPLGMLDTVVTLRPEQRSRLARMHARAPDGSLTPIDQAVGVGPSFFMGGGAYCGTGPDFLRFTQMFLNDGVLNGVRVLTPASVASMSSNQLGDRSVTPMRSLDRSLSNDIEFFPGIDKKWSAAFMINAGKAPTGRNAGSLCWAGAPNTYFWIDPTAGIAGIMLTQTLPFCDAAALNLFEAFERAVYDAVGEPGSVDEVSHP